MAFELVKLTGGLLMPLPIILILLSAGLVLLAARRRRLAAAALLLGSVSLLVLSAPPLSEQLLLNLENKYPVLHDPPEAEWIIVLGGGSRYEKNMPPASCLGESSLYRLAEGVRLAKLLPRARLATSGGDTADRQISTAELMAQVAVDWGIDRSRITTLTSPRNTAAEARAAAELIDQKDPVILVTSAFHMRRAKALFQGRGIKVIPAPAGHLVDAGRGDRHIGHQLPGSKYLGFAELALWEHLGLIWARIRGQTEQSK